MITRFLGKEDAARWFHDCLCVVLLTHPMLPYAKPTGSFLQLTKTDKRKGLVGSTLWFSCVLQPGGPQRHDMRNSSWKVHQSHRLEHTISIIERSITPARLAGEAVDDTGPVNGGRCYLSLFSSRRFCFDY